MAEFERGKVLRGCGYTKTAPRKWTDSEIEYMKKLKEAGCSNAEIADKGTQSDNVNHPSHYTDGRIEVIDFIEDKELGFHLGNAVKYISRAGRKNPDKTIEDLRKAVWYINRQIERLERVKND